MLKAVRCMISVTLCFILLLENSFSIAFFNDILKVLSKVIF